MFEKRRPNNLQCWICNLSHVLMLFFWHIAGEYIEMRYLTENRTTLVFDMPLAEVVTDYFDVLKSKSKVN